MNEGRSAGIVVRDIDVRAVGGNPGAVRLGRVDDLGRAAPNRKIAARGTRSGYR
jgi:hypothetical protein